MTVLLEVPIDDEAGSATILVEAERNDIPGGLKLASPDPAKAIAKATESLSESLDRLAPLLQTVKDKLIAAAPEEFTAEFGVKLGGETGVILAKGTAEVNFKITMKWTKS